MSEHMHADDELSPDEDILIARRAYSDGELGHALFHLSWALVSDPVRGEWLALAGDIFAQVDDPVSLVPLSQEGETPFAVAALRAYAFALNRDYCSALDLLGQVLTVRPEVPYLLWAVEWLAQRPDWEWQNVKLFFARAMDAIDAMKGTDRFRFLEIALDFLKPYADASKEPQSVNWFLASLSRRAGKLDEALRFAEQGHAQEPCWQSAIGLAMAHQALSNWDHALGYYEAAAEFEPEDETAYLDIGDLLCQLNRYDEAAGAYRRALDLDPLHTWALPSFYYAKGMESSDVAWQTLLEDYSEDHPDCEIARKLLEQLRDHLAVPFLHYLPEPQEALINLLQQVLASDVETTGELQVSVSHLEPPSSGLAWRMTVDELTLRDSFELRLNVGEVPEPDPRCVVDDVAVLWTYNGTWAGPALPRPPDSTLELVRDLASHEFNMEAWFAWATEHRILLRKDMATQLLATMVHPPEHDVDLPPWYWLRQVQMAATVLLAQLQDPWESDPKKNELLGILRGVLDWPVCSAVAVLAHLAQTRPEVRDDVFQAYKQLLDRVPRSGFCFFVYPLIRCWQTIPGLDDSMRKHLLEWQHDIEAEAE